MAAKQYKLEIIVSGDDKGGIRTIKHTHEQRQQLQGSTSRSR